MEKFIRYQIKNINSKPNENYGQFEVGPLETGFGITIGNALRRTILSNIPGASIFAIKIPGINHEFQAIEGLKEDVAQLILNLKQLVIKISSDVFNPEESKLTIENWPTMKINVKEAGTITADDIELPVGFEIVNKQMYIATKTDDAHPFQMEIYARTGRGYVDFKQNQETINSLPIIAVDSNFSPILQVGYTIEERKVSKNKFGDFIILSIATNGAISPIDAIAYAGKILVDHFEIIAQINDAIDQMETMSKEVEQTKQQNLFISITDLDLSVRSYNCLKRNGIQTIQELTNKTLAEIEKIKNLGKKSLNEIKKKVLESGLSFKEQ